MLSQNQIPIERYAGVTLYGRIIGKGGKLGQYGVHSDYLGDNGTVYHSYSEAQNRFKAIIGILKK